MSVTSNPVRCALIIGHPGHELRVFGWLHAVKPLVAVLTDGSGHGNDSRLPLTSEVIAGAGACASAFYGVTSDQELYRAILARDAAFFLALAERLAALLVADRIECVAGDAIEGYNPAHDMCRLVIDRAVEVAQQSTGTPIRNYAFSLVGVPDASAPSASGWFLSLSPDQLADKVAKSRRYALAAGATLAAEVDEMVRVFGEGVFAHEVLFPAESAAALAQFDHLTPYYEVYGAKQVAAGHYAQTIRYREHIAPLAAALACRA